MLVIGVFASKYGRDFPLLARIDLRVECAEGIRISTNVLYICIYIRCACLLMSRSSPKRADWVRLVIASRMSKFPTTQ